MYRRMTQHPYLLSLRTLLGSRPDAVAALRGSEEHPDVGGTVLFYQAARGVVVVADLHGLPRTDEPCRRSFFGFHLHDGHACTGNASDPFADAGSHDNPEDCPHPSHAGDFPPLLGADGEALLLFLTDRFRVSDVLGKTVIVHAMPDDFTSQPSGNAGARLACGEIRKG